VGWNARAWQARARSNKKKKKSKLPAFSRKPEAASRLRRDGHAQDPE
jgi:hypothetical protein